MVSRFITAIIILSLLTIIGCAGGGGSTGTYYGHRYGVDPWHYRGGYGRDRVHVVSEDELRVIEQAETASMPDPVEAAPDMGFGGFDGGGFDGGGFDGGGFD